MPRGKAWTKPETLALVEAFVHISEDEIVGVNQRKDTLFERVLVEAKQRYSGDWGRGTQACKSRWQIVSREVSKFIAADLLVNSIERSGWNHDDYFHATLLAYHGVKGDKGNVLDIHEDDLPLSDSELNAHVPDFEFKEEWLILRDHEKWRGALSKQESKRKAQRSSPDTSKETDDAHGNADESPSERPLGVKKAKTVLAMKNNQEAFLLEFKNQRARTEQLQAEATRHRESLVTNLMSHMDESAKTSFDNFQSVVRESTREMTQAVKVKLIIETDWSVMGKSLRGRMRKTMRQFYDEALEADGESLESSDEEDRKKPAKKQAKQS